MQRSTIDALISTTATVVVIVLFLAAAGLFFANNFVHQQVTTQLSAERIFFPEKESAAFKALPASSQAAIGNNAGKQLLTGAQAEIFANNYIAVHLDKIGGGKTYAELSEASLADPSDAALAGKVQTVFRGQALRGILLNAYAFDTMATVALVAAYSSLVAGTVLAVLATLGFSHAKKTRRK